MPQGTLDLADAPQIPVYYLEMVEANCDARMGKLQPGDIRPFPEDKARRWVLAGVATQTNKAKYDEQQNRRATKVTAQQAAFRALNDGFSMWDVSTYRDVLTAPEAGLRMAYERGIPLVNIHVLRDADGDPLSPEADIEDILDARDLMHPDLVAPFAAQDRSSVMGGGSHYSTPQPLSPQHRETMQRIADQEQYAQRGPSNSFVAGDDASRARSGRPPARGERGARAARRAGARNGPPNFDNPPDGPPARRAAGHVSTDAAQAAQDAGSEKPATEATGEQVGN